MLGPVGALAGGFGLIAGGWAATTGTDTGAGGARNDLVCRAWKSCSTNGLASVLSAHIQGMMEETNDLPKSLLVLER